MIAQIANGSVDPNWFFGGAIVLLLMITSWALTSILNRIIAKQEKHEDQLQDHETRITVIEKTE